MCVASWSVRRLGRWSCDGVDSRDTSGMVSRWLVSPSLLAGLRPNIHFSGNTALGNFGRELRFCSGIKGAPRSSATL